MADDRLNVFMDSDQLEEFRATFEKPAQKAILRVDSLPLSNEQKHEMVKGALLSFGASRLQRSVKELRVVPAEAIAVAADILISFLVSEIRDAISGGEK
jgi:hypothetical protein